jgi:hypothetical protein
MSTATPTYPSADSTRAGEWSLSPKPEALPGGGIHIPIGGHNAGTTDADARVAPPSRGVVITRD